MINKVILLGNIGKDIEVRTLANGNKVGNTTLATSENYKDGKGEWQTKAEWHNLSLWGNMAERKLSKGDQVYIEGKIVTNEYEKDGQKRYVTNINVQSLKVVSRKDKDPF